jgi:putative MATE family efflux protein
LPGAGVVGAAVATLVTQALAAVIAVIVLVRGSHGISLSVASLRPDFAYIKRAFLLGFPASIELSTRALGLMVLSFLISSFGTQTLAAYGVGSNVLQVVTIPALGLSTAVSTLVGQNIGARNLERANRTAQLGAALGFGVLTGVGIVAYLFAVRLVSFFIPTDANVIAEGAEFIRTMAPAWGFMGAQLCLVGTFRASGNMLAAMMLALVSQWVLQFPLAYVLSEHTTLGSRGLWWSFPVMNILIALISFAWFAKGDWKKTRLTEEDEEVILATRGIMTDEPLR